MKRFMISLSILILVVTSMGTLVSLDPWILPMGRIGVSAGWPTWAVRYGLLDFMEVGASMKEQGGYIKVGFGNQNFGVGFGMGTVIYTTTNIFASTGYKTGNFEVDLGGRFVQSMFDYGEASSIYFTVEGETSYLFSRKGNSESKVGLYVIYTSKNLQGEFNSINSGFYISASYKDVFFMPYVKLSGGLSFNYDGTSITLYRNFVILIDITAYFDVFRR